MDLVHFIPGVFAYLAAATTEWHSRPVAYLLVELTSIVVSASVFLLMWNSRRYMRNNSLIVIGASCLFAAIIDTLHILSWSSASIPYGFNSELWRVSRFVLAISFLLAPLMLRGRFDMKLPVVVYAALAAFVVAAVLSRLAPDAWETMEDSETWQPFWVFGDLITGLLFLVAAGELWQRRNGFYGDVARLLFASMIVLAFSEWLLVLRTTVGISTDLVTRCLQLAAFYLIYRAVVQTGLVRPFHLMFQNLQSNQTMLKESLDESRRQKAETEALLQGTHHILKQSGFNETAMQVFRTCTDLIGASTGRFIIRHSNSQDVLQLDAAVPLDPVCLSHLDQLAALVRASGKTQYHNHISAEGLPPREDGLSHCQNLLLTPLADGDGIYGMLMLANKPRGFNENDAYLASAFGELASIALSSSRARDELTASERKFKALVAHVPGAVYRSGFSDIRTMEFISDVIKDISGYPADEFMLSRVRSYKSIIHSADVQMVQECIRSAIEQRRQFDIEYRIVTASGEVRWVHDLGLATFDQSGSVAAIDGTIFDVTSRRLADEQLQESRRLLEMKVAERTAELLRANQALEAQIDERRKLEKQLLRTSELEQQRIGQELHDGLGQELAGLAFMVGALARRIASVRPQETRTITEILDLVHKAVNEVRGVSKGLYPVEVRSGGLALALRELAANTRKLFGVVCTFASDEDLEIHDTAVATHLYRIAQEAISNAIKHGQARNIAISLKKTEAEVILSIANDGMDFRADAVSTGLGMQIMAYRADVIGGRLEVTPGAKGGATVACSLPSSSMPVDGRAEW